MSQEIIVDGQKLVIKRVYKTGVEKVYQAWTDPDKMVRWLSSNERWRSPEIDVESVPGGKHNITMRHSDGDEFHIVGRYVEIVPNQRISFTWACPDGGMGEGETLVTVEFRAVTDGTELTLTHDRLDDAKVRNETAEGWTGCLSMLDKYLVDGVELMPI